MQWVYLIIAGILEWGWPVGLKYALLGDGIRWIPASIAIAFMVASGAFLMMAQKQIPMGTAYAICYSQDYGCARDFNPVRGLGNGRMWIKHNQVYG